MPTKSHQGPLPVWFNRWDSIMFKCCFSFKQSMRSRPRDVVLTVQLDVTNAALVCGLSKIDFVPFIFANGQDGTTLEDAICADPVISLNPALSLSAMAFPRHRRRRCFFEPVAAPLRLFWWELLRSPSVSIENGFEVLKKENNCWIVCYLHRNSTQHYLCSFAYR